MLGTDSPHPLGLLLPRLYLEDPFALALCAGLDCVLAPAAVAMDCIEAYFDPRLTPSDFLEWLAAWVGLSLDQNWSEEQRRALLTRAGELYKWQGTVRGVIEHIRLYTGAEPELQDSGGVGWSTTPGAPLPGKAAPELRVEVAVGPHDDVDASRVEAIVVAAKPAHVAHDIKVVRRGEVDGPRAPSPRMDDDGPRAPGPRMDDDGPGERAAEGDVEGGSRPEGEGDMGGSSDPVGTSAADGQSDGRGESDTNDPLGLAAESDGGPQTRLTD
jgi:phage tail-like protein